MTMNDYSIAGAVEKLTTGIPGFDLIAVGGLPIHRATLVSGTAGSGKSVFAAQFLAEGIRQWGHSGVFVTFEEPPEDIRRNMASLGWDIPAWEAAGKWVFVDASPHYEDDMVVTGAYDLGAFLLRLQYAIGKVQAVRVAIDSLGAIFTQFQETRAIRLELLRIATVMKQMQVTTVMTSEREQEYGNIARFGVEEFVADNVVILRNGLDEQIRHRTIEILKFRGTYHHKGEYPFTVVPEEGLIVVPLSAIKLNQQSTDVRVSSGNTMLDTMCGGGIFRDSIILVSGATGTGKTLMVTEFTAGGVNSGERCLLLAFEESREQLYRNAKGWGVDYQQMEESGSLKIISAYPENATLEDHLATIKSQIERFKPDRLALDSISALERITSAKGFREFVIGIASFVKGHQLAALFTATTPDLIGGKSVTDAHISTLTDSIVLLRYVESEGQIRRAITVLKMRGSMHEKLIREYFIDGQGMHIGEPFGGHVNLLTGGGVTPAHAGNTDCVNWQSKKTTTI
ncbi:MAG: circadian clock protein KaiC [Methylovulum sp.]|nr:circadian clock protein KaiC [Methylovulum sp.]